MERIDINNTNNFKDENLGVMLWKLETIENFYPCFISMIKKD